MKKILFYIPALWMGGLLYGVPAMADDSFAANAAGGSVVSKIIMTVGAPSCSLKKASQEVDFGDITVTELRDHARNQTVEALLTCDSIPAGITLTLSPVGSTADNVAAPGIVQGTLTGTGYKLTWAPGSSFGSEDTAVEYDTPLSVPASRITSLKMHVTPVATAPGGILSGESRAQVNVVLNFS